VQENSKQFFLVSLNRIITLFGAKESIDNRLWHQSKAPFKSAFLSMLARDLSTIVGSHFGLSKKCVLLDCDNTLWGGVIGEDGMTGIALDPYISPGAAFYEFQSYLLSLHQQGILLAVCSKNNEADVLEVFANHPNCLLKKEHFVCIRANWKDKAENILEISEVLQLGINSFVFIDDSHVECSLVQESIPDLDIIQAPKNPLDLDHIWQWENIFFTPHRTKEDAQKQKQYQDNEARRESSESFADIGKFLLSLETSVELFRNEAAHLERIAQLTQKTNQFNLRTVRYTLQDIESFLQSKDYVVFTMHVRDKFGDLGITNLCIMSLCGNGRAFVDTFLMSCRVIKRDLEFFFFNHCLQVLKQDHAVTEILAEFIPTRKNSLVEKFLDNVGLSLSSEEGGIKKYRGSLSNLEPFEKAHIHLSGVHN
jgi:FkbH-like protein